MKSVKDTPQNKAWKTMKKNEATRNQLKDIIDTSKRKSIQIHETNDAYIAVIKK